ncbi:MAG: hypothetical protein UV35_C0045G0007, partial [candidate division WWE3 bacterium GW2011_GWB1_42_6]
WVEGKAGNDYGDSVDILIDFTRSSVLPSLSGQVISIFNSIRPGGILEFTIGGIETIFVKQVDGTFIESAYSTLESDVPQRISVVQEVNPRDFTIDDTHYVSYDTLHALNELAGLFKEDVKGQVGVQYRIYRNATKQFIGPAVLVTNLINAGVQVELINRIEILGDGDLIELVFTNQTIVYLRRGDRLVRYEKLDPLVDSLALRDVEKVKELLAERGFNAAEMIVTDFVDPDTAEVFTFSVPNGITQDIIDDAYVLVQVRGEEVTWLTIVQSVGVAAEAEADTGSNDAAAIEQAREILASLLGIGEGSKVKVWDSIKRVFSQRYIKLDQNNILSLIAGGRAYVRAIAHEADALAGQEKVTLDDLQHASERLEKIRTYLTNTVSPLVPPVFIARSLSRLQQAHEVVIARIDALKKAQELNEKITRDLAAIQDIETVTVARLALDAVEILITDLNRALFTENVRVLRKSLNILSFCTRI